MSKQVENFTNHFSELANVVNAFRYEAVQIRVVDYIFEAIELKNKKRREFDTDAGERHNEVAYKTPGATKMLNQLVLTDFFNVPRSIPEIVKYCNEQFDAKAKPSDFSGVLLTLVKNKQLKREKSGDSNPYQYMRIDLKE